MWQTEKNLSIDEYNELSEYCNDYDELEAIHAYASTLQHAMSEKNVLGISNKRYRKNNFKKNQEINSSISDDIGSESIAIPDNGTKDDWTTSEYTSDAEYPKEKRQTLDYQEEYLKYGNQVEAFDSEDIKGQDDVASVDKVHKSKFKAKFSTNQTESLVDIDTVNGKVSTLAV